MNTLLSNNNAFLPSFAMHFVEVAGDDKILYPLRERNAQCSPVKINQFFKTRGHFEVLGF